MPVKPLYQHIAARLYQAMGTESTPVDIEMRNADEIARLCREFMPSGSGFDNGTTLDLDECKPGKRMTFNTAFHHINENGYYDGWTHHKVIVEADFSGFTVKVTGRNKRDIKDYIVDVFRTTLNQQVDAIWAGGEFSFHPVMK